MTVDWADIVVFNIRQHLFGKELELIPVRRGVFMWPGAVAPLVLSQYPVLINYHKPAGDAQSRQNLSRNFSKE